VSELLLDEIVVPALKLVPATATVAFTAPVPRVAGDTLVTVMPPAIVNNPYWALLLLTLPIAVALPPPTAIKPMTSLVVGVGSVKPVMRVEVL
jgi:hypothetical protein